MTCWQAAGSSRVVKTGVSAEDMKGTVEALAAGGDGGDAEEAKREEGGARGEEEAVEGGDDDDDDDDDTPPRKCLSVGEAFYALFRLFFFFLPHMFSPVIPAYVL